MNEIFSFLFFQPLDDFCKVIQKEIQTFIGRRIPNPDLWIFSNQNHPFAPESNLTASELVEKSEEQVRTIMALQAARIVGKELQPQNKQMNLKGSSVMINVGGVGANTINSNGGEMDAMLQPERKVSRESQKYKH